MFIIPTYSLNSYSVGNKTHLFLKVYGNCIINASYRGVRVVHCKYRHSCNLKWSILNDNMPYCFNNHDWWLYEWCNCDLWFLPVCAYYIRVIHLCSRFLTVIVGVRLFFILFLLHLCVSNDKKICMFYIMLFLYRNFIFITRDWDNCLKCDWWRALCCIVELYRLYTQ